MGSRHSRRLVSLLSFCFYSLTAFLVHSLSHTHSRQPLLFNSLKMLAANPPKCPFFLTHSVPVSPFKITCSASSSSASFQSPAEERSEIRLGLPSKGRMAADTLDLLRDCQLSVKHVNPRQYVAQIPQVHTRSLTHSLTLSSTICSSFLSIGQIYIVGGFCCSCPTWKCGFKGLRTLSGSCSPET